MTLALPGLAYSGLVMSEVVFYPVLALAAWAMAAALESPTRARQTLFVASLALAVATRIQAVILVPAFLFALVLDAVLARSRSRLRALVPALGGIGLLAILAGVWRLAATEPFLGGYAGAGGHYAPGKALQFVSYHAGDLALLSGVVPVCAVAVLLWDALRSGEADPRVRAYLAVSASLALSFVLEVGVFASRHVGLLAERDLIGLAPVLFLGLSLWLSRGGPGGYRARSIAALLVTGSVVAIPVGRFVVPDALPSAFSIIPLLHLRELTSAQTTRLVLGAGVAIWPAALFAVLPRARLLVLPTVVGLALVAGSVAASREVVAQAKAQKTRLLGPERRWVDAVARPARSPTSTTERTTGTRSGRRSSGTGESGGSTTFRTTPSRARCRNSGSGSCRAACCDRRAAPHRNRPSPSSPRTTRLRASPSRTHPRWAPTGRGSSSGGSIRRSGSRR